MKKLLCLILILVLLLATGCNQSHSDTIPSPTETEEFTVPPLKSVGDEVIYDGKLYSIERKGGKCYMKIKDDVVLLTEDELRALRNNTKSKDGETDNLHELQILHYPNINFEDVRDLVNKVTRFGLNLEDVSVLSNFYNNSREFEIIDVTRAFTPVMPSGYEVESGLWQGTTYTYETKFYKEAKSSTSYEFYRKDGYYSSIEHKNSSLKYYTKQELNDGYATQRWITATGHTRCTLYNVSRHGLSYSIYEYYDTKKSLDVPSYIVAYCNNEDVFFSITFNLGAIRPDIDWITEFYAVPYEY